MSRITKSDLVQMRISASLPPELLKELSGVLKLSLLGQIAIGHRTDDYALPFVFLWFFDCWPMFHIQECTPRFGVPGKSLHKRGVAVFTAMGTAHIRIDGIAAHRAGWILS